MSAFVRVAGPPNSSFLFGYPGVSSTLPRLEGTVQIRPDTRAPAPLNVSLVRVALQRRESIHPGLASSRKEITELVGKDILLYQSSRRSEEIVAMDLPFVIFLPFRKDKSEAAMKIPPASIHLSRTLETMYELVVSLQQGTSDLRRYAFPVPISRYDTLSTFDVYNQPHTFTEVSQDKVALLSISIPRYSYGPGEKLSVTATLVKNPDYNGRGANRAKLSKWTVLLEEVISFSYDEGEKQKTKVIAKRSLDEGTPLVDGYLGTLDLTVPEPHLRDYEGFLPPNEPGFPLHAHQAFTTKATLYKIEYVLNVRVHISSAKDVIARNEILICPFDRRTCTEEIKGIEQAIKDADFVMKDHKGLPSPVVVRVNDPRALEYLSLVSLDGVNRPLID